MQTMNVDIETYSDISIMEAGAYKYAESEEFEILIIAYSLNNEPIKAIDMLDLDTEPNQSRYKEFTAALLDENTIKYAFNANFERVCLARHYEQQMPPEQWRCTMVNSARLGLPLSLEQCAKALKLDAQKDNKGKALIRYFSMPCKPTKVNGGRTRNYPEHDTEKWQQFIDYCIKDVEVEQAIAEHVGQFKIQDSEQKLWAVDQHINDRGIEISTDLMLGAYELDKISKAELVERAKKLTGLDNPNSPTQLLEWFAEQGVEVPNMQKATVADYAKKTDGVVKEMLELRLQMAKTSVKKYNKMYSMAGKDNRIRGVFQFYGAGTGRWAGRGVQLQNLTKHYISDDELDVARLAIKQQEFEWLDMVLANEPQDLLSQLIRTTFIAKDGHKLAVSDFSAIEARVIAWYAGEQWRLDVFDTHGKIYEASAAQMFNVPVESIGKGDPLRQKGKVAELALGYQGGAGALKSMGALDMGIEENELKPLVDSWRKANPNIVNFWYTMQKKAVETVKTGLPTKSHGVKFVRKKNYLFIILPSGRALAYPNPRLETNSWGSEVIAFDGLDATRKWSTVKTYGGKLVENIVQATARDALAVSMVRLEKAGYDIVGHVHDEIILEVPDDGTNYLEDIERIMSLPIEWAEGLNLDSEGFNSYFYMKD